MNSGQMEKRLEWTGLDQNTPQPGPELETGAPKGPSNPQTQLPLPTAPLSLRCEFLSQVSGSLKPTSPHSQRRGARAHACQPMVGPAAETEIHVSRSCRSFHPRAEQEGT